MKSMFTATTHLHTKLRSITDEDFPFLLSVYASTRAAEFSVVDWSDEQKKFFIHSQFQLQHQYYQQQFATAEFQIITINGCDLGRLYYRWEENNLHLIDIALLPEYQHQGIGGALMHELMEQASARNGSVVLQVELRNSARDWYLRLGFVAGTDDGVYQKMYWTKK
jgi:ribosomal protein S18 acetylase RimI-like enzyme